MIAAPDFAAPILGWRAWLVVIRADGPRLESVVQPTRWEPRRELAGECCANHRSVRLFGRRRRPSTHPAPEASCTCGIYASADAELASHYVRAASFDRPHVIGPALGLVSLWGRVLECQRGWRAQYAYPARIYFPVRGREASRSFGVEELAFALADYGVPVEIVSHRGGSDLLRSLARRVPA